MMVPYYEEDFLMVTTPVSVENSTITGHPFSFAGIFSGNCVSAEMSLGM
jgi:hypothetical protein